MTEVREFPAVNKVFPPRCSSNFDCSACLDICTRIEKSRSECQEDRSKWCLRQWNPELLICK